MLSLSSFDCHSVATSLPRPVKPARVAELCRCRDVSRVDFNPPGHIGPKHMEMAKRRLNPVLKCFVEEAAESMS
ncbi:hypothetical protein ATANTOWER_010465 [Ataeniobius toweri]|uniref:Uncharacterized protein n=1 Tax=Ataeniobius toweri TaxID=208326 RepID=A0ABU7A5X2_9TELE|nr:hypothetical protein [Ataeniobius toweri]